MDTELLKKVLSDEVFVENLLRLKTAEQVQRALREKGLDFTIKNIYDLKAELNAQPVYGELTEDDLENVAGGAPTVPMGGVAGMIQSIGANIGSGARIQWQ